MRVDEHILNEDVWITAMLLTHTTALNHAIIYHYNAKCICMIFQQYPT